MCVYDNSRFAGCTACLQILHLTAPSNTSHLRRLLFLPVTLPISKLLDWALGRDVGQVFSQEELKRLMYEGGG